MDTRSGNTRQLSCIDQDHAFESLVRTTKAEFLQPCNNKHYFYLGMASGWTGFRCCTRPEVPRPAPATGSVPSSVQQNAEPAGGRMSDGCLGPGLGQWGRRCHDRWSRRDAVIMEQTGLPARTHAPFDISGPHPSRTWIHPRQARR